MGIKWPFWKTYKVRCPDGTVKTVYRQIEDAFPLYIPGWEGKININLAALQNLPADLGAEYATKIQGLLYSLDDLNQSLMMSFLGAYMVYKSDPCKKAEFFEKQVEELIKEQHRLRTLKMQIQGLISLAEVHRNASDQFIQAFKEIVNQLGGASIVEAASIEIVETRNIAKKMMGGENGS